MNDPIDDGGPAFPRFSSGSTMDGMSLRDWFAGQVIASGRWGSEAEDPSILMQCASKAYQLADAMIAARKAALAPQ